MAAGGMERLSPIIKSTSVRRLSLELCQKIGSQLLSPNLISQIRKPSVSSTPTRESLLSCTQVTQSPGQSGQGGYLPRRRCSDSYSHFYTNSNSTSETSPMPFNATRRKSLTPLNGHNHFQNVIQQGFHSPILAGAVKLGISPIPPSPTYEKSDEDYDDIDNDKNNNNRLIYFNKENEIQSPEEVKSEIAYYVIPPTPSSKGQRSKEKTSSSEDEGKVFISPGKQQQQEVSIPSRTRRRTSIARLTQGPSRRKSSTTRYDFDDEFLKFVLLRCKLHLSPEHILGRGGFGTVVAGTYRGKPVAVKVIKTKSEKKLESMKGEENALSLPPHPHIAKHIEILQIQPDKSLVVLERLQKGNLLAVINDPEVTFDLRRVIQISWEISSALDFCHSYGILHLDVKPQNILLDLHGSSKLSDFGNSKRISELENRKDFTKLDGTVAYKAPELFRGVCPTSKSDVFSLAISMWQMLTRETPYMAETEHSVIYKVVAQNLRPKAVCDFQQNSFIEQHTNRHIVLTDFIKLYQASWDAKPDHRPSMKTIHDQLSKLLTKLRI